MNAANRRPETRARASKPGNPVSAADPRKSWNCSQCESSNRCHDETCHICGNSGSSSECYVRQKRGGSNPPLVRAKSKRATTTSASAWSCLSCSFENSWLKTSCQICRAPKPSVQSRTLEHKQSPKTTTKRRRALPKQNLQHQQLTQQKNRWAYLKSLSSRKAPSPSSGAKSCESSCTNNYTHPTDERSEHCTRSSGTRKRCVPEGLRG